MNDTVGGFSFGGRRPESDDGSDDVADIDAIEVSGEPISRSEANQMGLMNLESSRQSRSATTKMRLEKLPPEVGQESKAKLEAAWGHLKKNEIEEALTLAQEVVWEHPSLVAAKVIIARCFIDRKEYDKALAILQAIPEEEKDPEILYYDGLCQSRLDHLKDAIESLRKSSADATDPLLRKRANDLLAHLQGELTECPECGKKVLYDSMVDLDNRMVCANCAKELEEGDDDEFDDDETGGKRKRRKKLRPPLTFADILIRLFVVFFLLLMLAVGGYLVYLLVPEHYNAYRTYLPASWHFLPETSPYTPTPLPEGVMGAGGGSAIPELPPIVPSLVFSSRPLERAVEGVELRHQLRIEGMESRTDGKYSVIFDPEPTGPYTMDPDTGLLIWTPDREDVGKVFDVRFDAIFGNMRSPGEDSLVRVSTGPKFKRVGEWQVRPGSIVHMTTEDLTGNGVPELLLFSGEYWRGEIAVFQRDDSGSFRNLAKASVSGRPVGAGVILAGTEKWLVIADYWNARLRFFTLRDGSLAEMAVTIELPGQPVLAGFDKERSVSVALCKVGNEMRVAAYRQEGQLNFSQIGEWTVPNDVAWKKLMVLPESISGSYGDGMTPVFALLGGNLSNSLYILAKDEPVKARRETGTGFVVDAAACQTTPCLRILAEESGELSFVEMGVGNPESVDRKAIPAGPTPALCGFGAFDLTGNGASDVMMLGNSRLGIAFGSGDGLYSDVSFWPLPMPARLFGVMTAIPEPAGKKGNSVLFLGDDDGIWSIHMAD